MLPVTSSDNMASLADQFTDLQIDEMKEAFSMFDRNKDGTVLLTSLVTVFKTLGIYITNSEIKVTFVINLNPTKR